MSAYVQVCLAVSAFLAGTQIAVAASVPQELIGRWSESTDEFCGLQFTAKGYTGSSDGEGYGCDVKSVQALPDSSAETPTWKIVFVCEGEFGRVQVSSIVRLRTIKGLRIMAHADTLRPQDMKKAVVPPLSILYGCQ
jgi:hypothetical protein